LTTASSDTDATSLDVLWQPIRIGTSLELNHRIIQSAHDQSWGGAEQLLSDKAIRYWADRAKGGAALVITGAQTIHRSALGHIGGGSEGWRPEAREQYRKLAQAVHRYDTKIFVQLGHWGAEDVGTAHLSNFRELLAPSDVPSFVYGEHPRPMEAADFAALTQGYVATAVNAQEAGCDGVEFHSAHGYLGVQFLSPLYNHRTDQYGGSTENRCRFAIEMVQAIRERCGRDYPLGIRLSFDEMHATGAGIDPDEGERIVRVLSATGLFDYFNISGGSAFSAHRFLAPMTSGLREQFVPYAELVKKIVAVPVFMAGRVTDIRRAAALVAEGKVDVVAMTRGHIADPEIVLKARSGRLDEIRECAGINQGCVKRIFIGQEMSCTQNPSVGREEEWGLGSLTQAAKPRRVLVVGGGPAGLKAAAIAAARGHQVSLYDRQDELGGQLRLAAMLPSRSEWQVAIGNLQRAAAHAGVDVHLGVDVTADLIHTLNPDVVIAATGSRFATSGWSIARGERDGIPGLSNASVRTPEEVLRSPDSCGEHVLIVEELGTYGPLGVAEFLADHGHQVRIVSRHMYIGEKTMVSLDLPFVYPRLAAKGVILQPQSFVEAIGPDGTATVLAMWAGTTEQVPVDTVVLMMGRQPSTELYGALEGTFPGDGDHSLHRIGDCVTPRDADSAFYEGERAGRLV